MTHSPVVQLVEPSAHNGSRAGSSPAGATAVTHAEREAALARAFVAAVAVKIQELEQGLKAQDGPALIAGAVFSVAGGAAPVQEK